MDLEKLTDDKLERIAYGRFRWETDIIARVGPAGRVAIDPERTLAGFSRACLNNHAQGPEEQAAHVGCCPPPARTCAAHAR